MDIEVDRGEVDCGQTKRRGSERRRILNMNRGQLASIQRLDLI